MNREIIEMWLTLTDEEKLLVLEKLIDHLNEEA